MMLQCCMVSVLLLVLEHVSVSSSERPPNMILFLADDFGYGDLSSYGHPTQEWGPIDKMAAEGVRFTQFYSVAVFCTPSRTSLLTGRYPQRSGMYGSRVVHLPCNKKGLPHSEVTVAEVLRDAGYGTGIVGKWHQGINTHSYNDGSFLPHTHGFEYVGHITPHTLVWDCDTWKRHRSKPLCMKCFLYRNTTIVQQPIALDSLTTTLLHDAKAFIHNNRDRPFFLLYSFPQTHTPMFNMERFKGSSRRGIYGDQVNEMSWAVGEILSLLHELDLDHNTLSMFTSDHGPHREMCEESGHPGMFKGGKGNVYEGGVRIPAIAHWPGTIPAGVTSTSFLTLMDLFSTFIELGNGKIPHDRIIDSLSFADLLKDPSPKDQASTFGFEQSSRHYYNREIRDVLFFYCMDGTLMAVRHKQFKVYFRISDPNTKYGLLLNCNGSMPRGDYYHQLCFNSIIADPPDIYNVENDPGEDFPLNFYEYEEVVNNVINLVKEHQQASDFPEPLLVPKNCARRYIPCCNPPYCTC